MAYIRKRGKQLVLAHGERDKETGHVDQRILFALYSKAEAKAALDKSAHLFEGLIQAEHPKLKFNWTSIRKAIKADMDVLPDEYDHGGERVGQDFRSVLCRFARELMLTDPQELDSSVTILDANRQELEYLRGLIDYRLKIRPTEPSTFTQDDVFYWRSAMRGATVPHEIEEEAAGFFEKRELDKAKALFGLLVDSFDEYAEGHNYLGLIALDADGFDEAIAHFEKTIAFGRKLFPKRIAKGAYWADHATRPYMRGLLNLATTFNRAGRFEEALHHCARLDVECGNAGRMLSESVRAAVCMNLQRFDQAAAAGEYLQRGAPSKSLVVALALFERGIDEDATVAAVHGLLNSPRSARMLVGRARFTKPETKDAFDDHNAGVDLLRDLKFFLMDKKRLSLRLLDRTLSAPLVVQLLEERDRLETAWSGPPRDRDKKVFERLQEMKRYEFAGQVAKQMRRQPTHSPNALH